MLVQLDWEVITKLERTSDFIAWCGREKLDPDSVFHLGSSYYNIVSAVGMNGKVYSFRANYLTPCKIISLEEWL